MQLSDYFDLQAEPGLPADIRRYWKSLLALTAIALLAHIVLWRSWPLYIGYGTDPTGQVGLYVDAFESSNPVQFWQAAYRGPIPPLFYGLALNINPLINPIGLTIMAVLAIDMVFLIVIPWGHKTALFASLLCLVDLPVQLLFHQVASECFAAFFLVATLLALRYALSSPHIVQWALVGVGVGLSTLSRPNNLAFVVFVVAILACKIPIRRKLWLSAVAIAVAFLTFSPWIVYRGLRYGVWTIERGAGYAAFFEVYDDELVQPGNGPATEKLANLLNDHLLNQSAYRAAQVSLNSMLRADHDPIYQADVYSANWYAGDIVYVVDLYEGWDSDYKLLGDVAWEGVRAHPWEFVQAMARGLKIVLLDYDIMLPATPRPVWVPIIPGVRSLPPIYSIYYSHPNNVPEPSVPLMRRDRQRTRDLLAPLAAAEGDVAFGNALIAAWKAVWPPFVVVYSLAVVAIIANRGKAQMYLLVSTLSTVGMTALTSLFGNLPRYRMPFESVVLISAAVGAAFVLSALYRIALRNYLKTQVVPDASTSRRYQIKVQGNRNRPR